MSQVKLVVFLARARSRTLAREELLPSLLLDPLHFGEAEDLLLSATDRLRLERGEPTGRPGVRGAYGRDRNPIPRLILQDLHITFGLDDTNKDVLVRGCNPLRSHDGDSSPLEQRCGEVIKVR